jgi:thioredoxin reductase (NADPH)
MTGMWDVVVIGAGPAGLSAARAAAARGLRTLCLDRLGPGGALMNLGALHHCPELPEGTTGPDLAAQLMEAATEAGAELGFGEVREVRSGEGAWTVVTDEEEHQARALVLASGLLPGRLGVAGEGGFEGQGLSRCAACDGPLYRGQSVVVAGSDEWACLEAEELLPIAASVTLVHEAPPAAMLPPGVATIEGRITALEGEGGLETVVVGDGRRIAARAVFVQRDRAPAIGYAAPDLLGRDSAGHPIADSAAARAGVFVVGDLRAGSPRHLAAALAEGRAAGEAVLRDA